MAHGRSSCAGLWLLRESSATGENRVWRRAGEAVVVLRASPRFGVVSGETAGAASKPGAVVNKLRLLDLFSGIGGFSLGLERSGFFETVAFCEIEPFPRRVLAKHWPKVPCYDDVRLLTAARLSADGIAIDAICGGFPCQDISVAGKGAGIDGERSGLWREIARLASELRPRIIVLENSPALLGRGLGRVLGDLSEIGYDSEWHCISAADIGAPHLRDRIWIVAYPDSERQLQPQGCQQDKRGWACNSSEEDVADADSSGRQKQWFSIADVAKHIAAQCSSGWPPEPAILRVAHGIPDRFHRIEGLGNAVVPQIPEMIGCAIGQMMGAA